MQDFVRLCYWLRYSQKSNTAFWMKFKTTVLMAYSSAHRVIFSSDCIIISLISLGFYASQRYFLLYFGILDKKKKNGNIFVQKGGNSQ